MNVFENVAFGLRLKKPKLTEKEIQKKVEELLGLVHLPEMGRKYPSELSGGERQRVALARVLAVEPKFMLLDEPFGALDAKVRKELRRWLRKLHDATGLTTIFVTHDQEEAMEMSDRIAILDKGELVQVGTPMELWEAPKNAFVYDFLGRYNTFKGFETEKGELIINPAVLKNRTPSPLVKAFARPHEVTLERNPADKSFFIPVKVTFINSAGPLVKIEAEEADETLYQLEIDKSTFQSLTIQMGETLWLRPKTFKIFHE
jgi:sulfate transport system ATP-binding protein